MVEQLQVGRKYLIKDHTDEDLEYAQGCESLRFLTQGQWPEEDTRSSAPYGASSVAVISPLTGG